MLDNKGLQVEQVDCSSGSGSGSGSSISWLVLLQVVSITAVMSVIFIVSKRLVDAVRSHYCRLSVVVLGAGPVGLLSALVTLRSGRASRLVVFEEHPLADLLARGQPLTLDLRSVTFMRGLGVRHLPRNPQQPPTASISHSNSSNDCASESDDTVSNTVTGEMEGQGRGRGVLEGMTEWEVEGEWHDNKLHTCAGDLIRILLHTISHQDTTHRVEFRFGCKFVRQSLQELETMPDRLLAIVCDGASGRSASLLGLSDEFFNVSCKTYGAMADLERLHLPPHPSPFPPPPFPHHQHHHHHHQQQQQDTFSTTSHSVALRHSNSKMMTLRRGSVVAPPSTSNISSISSRMQNIGQSNSVYDADGGCTDSACAAVLEEDQQQETGKSSSSCLDDIRQTVTRYTRPTADRLIHGITFDLSQHGRDFATTPSPVFEGGSCGVAGGGGGGGGGIVGGGGALLRAFHLKIFGSLHHRYLALAVSRTESDIVRGLKACSDHSVMRSVFQTCFNAYKAPEDAPMSDAEVATRLRCSARLYDIKLSQRRENVAFVEDANVFVVTEGDAARHCNFRTGLDVNLAMRGLTSLESFVHQAACADSDDEILATLRYKYQHHQTVCHDFVRNGLRTALYPPVSPSLASKQQQQQRNGSRKMSLATPSSSSSAAATATRRRKMSCAATVSSSSVPASSSASSSQVS